MLTEKKDWILKKKNEIINRCVCPCMASCNIVSLQEMLKLLPSLQLVFRVKVLFLVHSFF